MQIQLIRHATLRLQLGGVTLLVDPMLSDAEAMDPIQNASNSLRIPLVPLPFQIADILKDVSAVLVTHTHRDHWDAAATESVPKSLPILCQPEDEAKFREWGYVDVTPIRDSVVFHNVEIARTGGQHGTGEIGRKMAPVSGFALRAPGEPSVYVAGDTIFCPEVESALSRFMPVVTVVNTGAAQFLEGDPITMTAADVVKVCRRLPTTEVVAVHMEAINHCHLKRADLAEQLRRESLRERVRIPADGEICAF